MKRKLILFSLLSFCLIRLSFAQGCPPNIDFEQGTFANWECFIGNTYVDPTGNVIDLKPSAPLPDRHEILSSKTDKDYYGGFPTLCPYGGKYSVKLGNDQTGSEAEGISYTFTVPATEDTFSFTYFYAVVFQDPNHIDVEQPRFFVTAYDVLTGALINCASYNYIATSSLPGFKKSKVANSTDVLYKDWSPVSIQFAGLANRKVRLEFRTGDCTQSGHFGYAYLDVGAGCSNILATAPYCIETNSIILNAPYGFKDYTWYNHDYTTVIGFGQSLTLSPPPATNNIFHVDMEPYPGFGCRDTVDAVVTPLPVPDTPVAQTIYNYCQFDYSTELTATGDIGNEIWWYTSETGGVGTQDAPTPSTLIPGVFTFYVSQKILFGCESFRRKITVTVTATPKSAFTIDNNRQCQNGNVFQFTNASSNLDNSTYTWDWGDGKTSTLKDDKHTYDKFGVFTVKMNVLNPPVCGSELVKTVTVIPKPVADYTVPPVICENNTPIVITDKSYVQDGLATINKWWWNIDGKVSTTQIISPFTNKAGKLPVKFVVGTVDGCLSDTNTAFIAIKHNPKAAFSYQGIYCNNELIRFTSKASMPAGATGESVVKWNWVFDNTVAKTETNPSFVFSQGLKHVTLQVESNFGCVSTIADSTLIIYTKPHARLDINDSCVFRNINYSAVDLSGSINKWYWNFGNGLKEDAALITKSFKVEGNNPVVLIGETIHGCKDTINRPFTIFDNKAFAGRDTLAAFTQPVQLNAHGGPHVTYTWTPSTGLNNASIENPIALLDRDQLYKLDAMSDKGCDAHSQIFIKRWKGPELYIPTAFSPNADGHNETLSVFPVGIKTFYFFAVYNRLGQEVFHTTDYTKKWDGTFKGAKCDAGNYVAVAKATDYNNQQMLKKVNVLLVR